MTPHIASLWLIFLRTSFSCPLPYVRGSFSVRLPHSNWLMFSWLTCSNRIFPLSHKRISSCVYELTLSDALSIIPLALSPVSILFNAYKAKQTHRRQVLHNRDVFLALSRCPYLLGLSELGRLGLRNKVGWPTVYLRLCL